MEFFTDPRKSVMEGINLDAASVLVELIGNTKVVETELLERRFRERAQNFEAVLKFMNALEALVIRRTNVCCTNEFDEMREALKRGKHVFARYIAVRGVESRTVFGRQFEDVIRKFSLKHGQACLALDGLAGTLYSARNFLLDTGALQFDYQSGTYRINDWFYRVFIRVRYTRGTTPERLNSVNEEKAKIGNVAELAVFKHECEAVGHKDAQNVIHVALENVSAGFDIASVRREENTGEPRFRMIEVKAVSLRDWSFTMTKNEVRVARENENAYFLYLVPVIRGEPQIEKMDIIRNPAKNLLDESKWVVERGDWNVCRVNHNG